MAEIIIKVLFTNSIYSINKISIFIKVFSQQNSISNFTVNTFLQNAATLVPARITSVAAFSKPYTDL